MSNVIKGHIGRKMIQAKKYLSDETINSYHIMIELVNRDIISLETTLEEYMAVKIWFECGDKENYQIKRPGNCININKSNVVKFSYSEIKNKDTVMTRIMYFLTTPVSKTFNLVSYVQALITVVLFTAMFGLLPTYIWNMYHLEDPSFGGTLMLSLQQGWNSIDGNFILTSVINVLSATFILIFLVSFIMKFLGMISSNGNLDYVYEVEKQIKNKFSNFAIIQLLFILILQGALIQLF